MSAPATTEIDGHSFQLSLLSSSEGLKLGMRLARTLGSAMSQQVGTPTTFQAVMALFTQASPEESLGVVKKVLQGCLMDGKPLFGPGGAGGIYETAFIGRVGLQVELMVWALSENLGDFTELLVRLRDRLKTVADRAGSLLSGDDGATSPTSGPSGGRSVAVSAVS